jgi:hypothetical protein
MGDSEINGLAQFADSSLHSQGDSIWEEGLGKEVRFLPDFMTRRKAAGRLG